jgi:nicotinamidase-related amidase
MTNPARTLLDLAGAPTHPSALDRSVLVIIDAQRDYLDGVLPLAGIGPALEEAARLLALARREGVPVVHVVHHGKPGAALFDPTGPGSEILPAVAPIDGEAVIVKGLPNSFAGTELDRRLKLIGRPELILAGFMTHMCVSSTARAALDLGYRNTIVANATATRDLPDGAGGVIPAAELHRANLAALSDRFSIVVPDHRAWA